MKRLSMIRAVAALSALAAVAVANRAEAADCSTMTTNPIVYLVGAANSKPFWAALAPKLTGIGLVFQPGKSCIGLNEVTTGGTDPLPAFYMDGSANGVACTNPGAAMLNDSDVFAATCSATLPTGFKEFIGPVQTMVFAVPYASSESSISSDAAYTVFGWGGTQYPVAPWTNYSVIFSRPTTAGTILLMGSGIGLAASKWLSQVPDGGAAQQIGTPAQMVTALQNAGAGATPSAAIGILANDLADSFRGPAGQNDAGTPTGGLKVLAFQAATQTCAYLPDSDSTHFDKINVRQGRYDLWGPIHLTAPVDASGNPTNASVATIINTVTNNGLTEAQYQPVVQAAAKAHIIPQCAMQVSRASEVTPAAGGGMASYQPPMGCGCYWETLVNGGTPYSKYCKACPGGDTDCAGTASTPKCHFGYCEAK